MQSKIVAIFLGVQLDVRFVSPFNYYSLNSLSLSLKRHMKGVLELTYLWITSFCLI